ncbi:hypothetical protein TNCV_4766871 [Trichonephila clavipes]|nr:hypothetical protein TNCV_4766871 [Trichonephila clavipes]
MLSGFNPQNSSQKAVSTFENNPRVRSNDLTENLLAFIADTASKGKENQCDGTPLTLMTATAGSDVVQSGRPIFDDFFQHLWPYIGNNTANAVFQMVKRLWLIRIDQ